MATYQVASALAPLADRMVASRSSTRPRLGLRLAAVLADDPDTTADELGWDLLAVEAQAVEQGTQDQITLSLIDLTQMGAVDDGRG